MMKFVLIIFIVIIIVPVSVLRSEQVMKFKAIEIKGKVQKPQVTYILPKSRLLKIGVNINDLKPELINDVWDNLSLEKNEEFR